MATKKTPKKPTAVKAKSKVRAVAAKAAAAKPSRLSSYTGLRTWNLRFGVLLVLQAAAIVITGRGGEQPVTLQYLAKDPLATDASGHEVLATASRHLFDLPVSWVVAAFLLLLAATHIVVATVYRNRYETALDRGPSEARWVGLGLTASVAVLAVALLSGVHNLASLLVLSVLTFIGYALVLAREALFPAGTKRLLSHVICGAGVVAILAPWVVFALGIAGSLAYDGTVPLYMYGVYAIGIIAFLLGLDMTHRRMERSGRFIDSLFTEKAYIVFGFVAVSALAWAIYAGALAA